MTDQTQPASRRQQITVLIRERQAKVLDAIKNIRRAFGLVWRAHWPSSLAMAASTLVGALLPAGQAIDLNVDQEHRTIGPAVKLQRAVLEAVSRGEASR